MGYHHTKRGTGQDLLPAGPVLNRLSYLVPQLKGMEPIFLGKSSISMLCSESIVYGR